MVQNLVVVGVVVDHNLDIRHIRHSRHIRHNPDNSLQEVHMHCHQVVVHNFVLPKEQVPTLMMEVEVLNLHHAVVAMVVSRLYLLLDVAKVHSFHQQTIYTRY